MESYKRHIEVVGNDYLKQSLISKEFIPFKYEKNKIPIGRDRDGNIFSIKMDDAIRCIVVGKPGCMPKGTLIHTPDGLKPIEDVKVVDSWNFKHTRRQYRKANVIYSGKKKIVKIKTKLGVIKCSEDHKWFVKRDGKVEVIETKDLKKTDNLLKVIRHNSKQNRDKNHEWLNLDEKKIKRLYTEKKLSLEAIAKEMGCSRCAINKRIINMGIKKRQCNEQTRLDRELGRKYPMVALKGKLNGQYKHGKKVGQKANRKIYLKVAKGKKWVCEMCGAKNTNEKFDLIVHHKDRNNKNNSIDNLQILCARCHALEHVRLGDITGRKKCKK